MQRHGDHRIDAVHDGPRHPARRDGGQRGRREPTRPHHKVTADLDGADMYSVMAVLAVACNYSPVIVLKHPSTTLYSGLGITEDSAQPRSPARQRGADGNCVPNALAMLQTIDKYNAAKFAKLIGMLDSISNGDGSTLLDSSAAVWFNEILGRARRQPQQPPGHPGGRLRRLFQDRLDRERRSGEPGLADLTQGNSEAQCGRQRRDGRRRQPITGPIPARQRAHQQVLLQPDERRGREGGRDRASLRRAAARQVTRFGYSDLTTDFCGGFGAVAGAGIHGPGEYTALKSG